MSDPIRVAGIPADDLARSIEGHYDPQRELRVNPRFAAVDPVWVGRLVVAGRSGPAHLVRADTGAEIATVGGGGGRAIPVPASACPDLEDAWEHHLGDVAVRRRLVERWMRAGVRFDAPERTLVDGTVSITAGARIGPDVVLRGDTRVGEGAWIDAGCILEDTTVGARATIRPHTVATGATIGARCTVGPFAHLRAGAVLEDDVKVGNFVEVKKTVLRAGAKASHLSYLGDAEVGAGANVGAGTITCNYDGYGKHRTLIGARAFIGSNTALVAPVRVGDGAIVGAGSVITQDVPDDALAVERCPQRTLDGRAPRIRARNARNAGKDV